ncbi:MAG: PIN domain-containing protein [Kiritimatiellae bacterium]|nr:PIN domain-containing protein [Kiritimatiellia bacterium]
MRFFDTNILLYAATDQDARKGDSARELIAHAITVNHDGCISTQVLGEFANVMVGKLKQSHKVVDGYLDYFRDLLKTGVTIDLVRRTMDVKEEYGIQFYDALIVSTAEKIGCTEIVSEDLNPGQTYRGMAVVNPF